MKINEARMLNLPFIPRTRFSLIIENILNVNGDSAAKAARSSVNGTRSELKKKVDDIELTPTTHLCVIQDISGGDQRLEGKYHQRR